MAAMGIPPRSISSETDAVSQFHSCQIVCLEHEATRLYAEVVQVVDTRQICWARPLMLVTGDPNTDTGAEVWYDLREGADLLCPIALFRAALDVEVIPLLTHLYGGNPGGKGDRSSFQQLREFLERVWKAYPQAFQN